MKTHFLCALNFTLFLAGCGVGSGGKMSENDNEIASVTIDGKDMILMPSSVSAQRVEQLGLPQKGSEDVSHLLVKPPNLPWNSFGEERDYRPEDAVEWVIDIEFEGSPILTTTQITNAFDQAWLEANGRPTVYGWSPEIKHWTYLVSADAPKTFTKLAIGWALYKSYDEEYRLTSGDMDRFQATAQRKASLLGRPLLRANRTPRDAERLEALIREAVTNCNRDVVLVLNAPKGKPFDGKAVWDVMMCLGLPWGDGDLFHWHNESGFGHDMFFSVETSTPPGYFLPESIAAGKTRVGDLIFGFSIPRSAEPLATLDSMVKAVAYVKKRLGGEILGRDGLPFDESQLKKETQGIVEQLRAAGFKPGESATLHVF